jgi:hypothetical protein
MQIETKRRVVPWAPEALAMTYMGIIAFAAHATGVSLLLFPELAALSHDVLSRPRGRWASQPLLLIFTPTAAAIVGICVTRYAQYNAVAIALIMLLSLLVIRLFRSTIAPAISAGVLPMVLSERSWIYPAAIFVDLIGLVGILLLWQRFGVPREERSKHEQEHSAIVDPLEVPPRDRFWLLTLLTFVLVLGVCAQVSGLRFLLFPPLLVMAYEIFGHSEVPRWMARPAFFPLVCLLTASVGTLACRGFQTSFIGVAVTMLVSIGILRAFKLHMPPALAVGVLPFVMVAPNLRYPVSVALGTAALTLYAAGYRALQRTYRLRKGGDGRAHSMT